MRCPLEKLVCLAEAVGALPRGPVFSCRVHSVVWQAVSRHYRCVMGKRCVRSAVYRLNVRSGGKAFRAPFPSARLHRDSVGFLGEACCCCFHFILAQELVLEDISLLVLCFMASDLVAANFLKTHQGKMGICWASGSCERRPFPYESESLDSACPGVVKPVLSQTVVTSQM